MAGARAGKPSRTDLQGPGKTPLTTAAGCLELPEVSFLSASPLANQPDVPCAAAGHGGVCGSWRQ